jgi:uncharacterized protein
MIESYIILDINVHLIGSSLGGFYAKYLAQKYDINVVLINPAINADKTLVKFIGESPNFYDNSHFEWNQEHIEMLKKYQVNPVDINAKTLLLLQKGDALLNYKEAYRYYESIETCQTILEDGGSHSFEKIEDKFHIIDKFFNN